MIYQFLLDTEERLFRVVESKATLKKTLETGTQHCTGAS
jgi:hypothetical protein